VIYWYFIFRDEAIMQFNFYLQQFLFLDILFSQLKYDININIINVIDIINVMYRLNVRNIILSLKNQSYELFEAIFLQKDQYGKLYQLKSLIQKTWHY